MYVELSLLIEIGKILGGLVGCGTVLWKLFKWINHQKEQDEKLEQMEAQHEKDVTDIREDMKNGFERLEQKHDADVKAVRESNQRTNNAANEELTLITYGLLAALQGLQGMIEQPSDGPIPRSIDKINKYLNEKAHDQQ